MNMNIRNAGHDFRLDTNLSYVSGSNEFNIRPPKTLRATPRNKKGVEIMASYTVYAETIDGETIGYGMTSNCLKERQRQVDFTKNKHDTDNWKPVKLIPVNQGCTRMTAKKRLKELAAAHHQ